MIDEPRLAVASAPPVRSIWSSNSEWSKKSRSPLSSPSASSVLLSSAWQSAAPLRNSELVWSDRWRVCCDTGIESFVAIIDLSCESVAVGSDEMSTVPSLDFSRRSSSGRSTCSWRVWPKPASPLADREATASYGPSGRCGGSSAVSPSRGCLFGGSSSSDGVVPRGAAPAGAKFCCTC